MGQVDITQRHPTRTLETELAYARRVRQLISRASEHLQIKPAKITADDLTREIRSRAQELSTATLRQYRAAIAFGLDTDRIPAGASETPDLRTACGQPRGRFTSSLKSKRIRPRDLRRIDGALRRSSSQYARELRAFLLANMIVGARVTEWRSAHFVERHAETGAPALVLANAKHTNTRAHGPTRTLHLGGLSPDAITTIATCASWLSVRHAAGTFAQWQAGAAKLLQRLGRKLWPRRRRHITLYSTRHHAAARYKALYGQAEVAALLGHAALTTAGTHYARTARGARHPSPSSCPQPRATDVARVLERALTGGPALDPPPPDVRPVG